MFLLLAAACARGKVATPQPPAEAPGVLACGHLPLAACVFQEGDQSDMATTDDAATAAETFQIPDMAAPAPDLAAGPDLSLAPDAGSAPTPCPKDDGNGPGEHCFVNR
jgi:hypothetical protein